MNTVELDLDPLLLEFLDPAEELFPVWLLVNLLFGLVGLAGAEKCAEYNLYDRKRLSFLKNMREKTRVNSTPPKIK